jgi:hypothetical protein
VVLRVWKFVRFIFFGERQIESREICCLLIREESGGEREGERDR